MPIRFKTNLNFKYQQRKSQEIKGTIAYQILNSAKEPLFFMIFKKFVPKIEIRLKYFLVKNSQMQP